MAAERPGAVVLLSGGLDSATSAAVARSEGYRLYALSFDYGQRHRKELEAAGETARKLQCVEHLVLSLELGRIGGSALTSRGIEVPKGRIPPEGGPSEIPVTYVPARNTIFLSYALAWAEVLRICDIFAGMNALDYSGYPDCRPEYVAAFEQMANLATRMTTEGGKRLYIRTPLIQLTKAQIILLGRSLGVDFASTWSCYNPDAEGKPCGDCDSCILRERGFTEAGLSDPLRPLPGRGGG